MKELRLGSEAISIKALPGGLYIGDRIETRCDMQSLFPNETQCSFPENPAMRTFTLMFLNSSRI